MEDTDIIRIAIDLRHASHFERFWDEQRAANRGGDSDDRGVGQGPITDRSQHQHPRSLDRA